MGYLLYASMIMVLFVLYGDYVICTSSTLDLLGIAMSLCTLGNDD